MVGSAVFRVEGLRKSFGQNEVLGGVSLFGGKGSAIGAIFGALAFRTIGDMLFVFNFDPLWQPLFQGIILMVAVTLGAFGLLRVRNRLEWFS